VILTKEKLSNIQVMKLDSSTGIRAFLASLVTMGFLRSWGGRQSNRYIPKDTLVAAVNDGKFDNLAVFVDHAGLFEYPKVERLVAVTKDSYWDDEDNNVKATIEFYSRPLADAMINIFDGMLENENKPDVGFSLVFWGRYADREEIDDPLVLAEISHIESADIVFEPASEGARVLEALSVHYGIQKQLESEKTNTKMIDDDHTNNSPNSPEFGLAMVGKDTSLA